MNVSEAFHRTFLLLTNEMRRETLPTEEKNMEVGQITFKDMRNLFIDFVIVKMMLITNLGSQLMYLIGNTAYFKLLCQVVCEERLDMFYAKSPNRLLVGTALSFSVGMIGFFILILKKRKEISKN